MKSKLGLMSTAIGSLPHINPNEAMNLIFTNFPDFPVFPQLAHYNPKEDMTSQLAQNIPGIIFDEKDNRWYMDQESELFYEQLEEFYLDYESIVNENDFTQLEKYAITEEYASCINLFLDGIKKTKPAAAKVQIIGPFTYGTTLVDREKKCAFYDETLREIIIKGLTLKALWLVNRIKTASAETTPVIFIDEPSMSQYGSTAFITITKENISGSIAEISDVLKKNGALTGAHCCGKTDWSIITDSGVNILNFDCFYFAESLALYSKEIEKFLKNSNYIAWGVVPTLDEDALKASTPESLVKVYENAVAHLINKNISSSLIYNSSIITPTCGAGSLNIELSEKAMELTASLAEQLREKYLLKGSI